MAARVCRKGWTVWDCGGYMGFYTNLFARLVGPEGCVVVFEPDPRAMRRIREYVALNRFTNVQFVEAAIGAPLGETDFILSDNTNSHLPGAYVGATREEYAQTERRDGVIRVRCMSLDEAFLNSQIPAPQLVKMDLDGAEGEALQHCQGLAERARPLFLLELHNPECDAAALEFAQRTGYTLQSTGDGRILQSREEVGGTLLCSPPS